MIASLGRGGMGEVFLGEQVSIQTRVAIKVLHREISSESDHVQRFFNEARVVSRIKHAGIVKIFDVGFHDGHAYLVMELLEGESLAKRIERSGRLSATQIADFGRQIASALAATHAAGVIHRDLKPDNIFITTDHDLPSGERVKLLDFGIAKLSGTLVASSPRTVGTMGTPAYMAPEQWGNSAHIDWRADAYSLGCVAFEMAVGAPPFDAPTIADACAKHLTEVPPPARSQCPDVPPALDELIARLLTKKPGERGASMVEIAEAFDVIDGGPGGPGPLAPTLAPGAPAPARVRRTNRSAPIRTPTPAPAVDDDPVPPRRSRVPLVIGGSVVIAGAIVAFALTRSNGDTPSIPAVAPVTPAPSAPPPTAATPATPPAPPATAPPPTVVPPPIEARPTTKPAVVEHAHAATPHITPKIPKHDVTKPPTVNCDPPYTVDGTGKRTYKKECL